MNYDPCPHVVDACDSCALKQAEAWIEHYESALEEIAKARGDLAEQAPYWAKDALAGLGFDGKPVPGLSKGIEVPDPSGSDDNG
jgi:hypothetical protein